jgi:hypothetical protein
MGDFNKNYVSRFFVFLICCSFILIAIVSLGLLDLPSNHKPAELINQNKNILKNQLLDSLKSKITKLKVDELFWQNRIKLAGEKKISFIIDLIDSLAILEFNGITLRRSKIIYYKKSTFIQETEDFLQWLTFPFILQDEHANFLKEPIKEKRLSIKDTTSFMEYHTSHSDTNTNLYFRLNYNRNLSINILQVELPYFGVWPENIFTYIYNLNVENLPTNSKYWINIFLPRSDIIALYRALSLNCKLILRT